MFNAGIDFFTNAAVSFRFGVSSSLHQSRIWIKSSLMSLRVAFSPQSGDQKFFGSLPGIYGITHLKAPRQAKKPAYDEKTAFSRRCLMPLSISSPMPQFHSVSVSVPHCTSHPSGLRSR